MEDKVVGYLNDYKLVVVEHCPKADEEAHVLLIEPRRRWRSDGRA